MNKKRFGIFLEVLQSKPHIPNVEGCKVIRQEGSDWKCDEHADMPPLEILTKARELGKVAIPKCKDAAFWIPDFQAVAYLSFKSRPRDLQSIAERLSAKATEAKERFDASHDALTHLRNRASFDKRLAQIALGLEIPTSTTPPPSNEPATSKESDERVRICLVHIDIDKFKQINDSYTHAYGNTVIGEVAKGINTFCQSESKFQLEPFRTGGEEFAIIASGRFNKTQIDSMFKRLSEAVQTRNYQKPPGYTDSPPITVSIGCSHLYDQQPVAFTAEALQLEADRALQRAKAGGRNCHRFYSDIRDKHGFVLEHMTATNIVAIDIGTDVGVQLGDEFSVYHPTMAGNNIFYVDDGRSKRQLGKYPRIWTSIITVVDPQAQMSFCKLVKNDGIGPLAAGSHLELIPIGRLTHTVLSSQHAQKANLETLTHRAKRHMDLCIAVVDTDSTQARRGGTNAVNTALSHLYNAIHTVSAEAAIYQLVNAVGFGFYGLADDDSNVKARLTLMAKHYLANALDGVPCGFATIRPLKKQAGQPASRAKACLAIASGAAAAPNGVIEYSAERTNGTTEARLASRYDLAIDIWRQLDELNLATAPDHNQAALAFSSRSKPDYSSALACIDRAIKSDPAAIFRANRALLLFEAGRNDEAFEAFQEMDFKDVPSSYVGPFALSVVRSTEFSKSQDVKRLALSLLQRAGATDTVSVTQQVVDEAKKYVEDQLAGNPTK